MTSRLLKIGVELSGNATADRARGYYLLRELKSLGLDVKSVNENDAVDIRIMLKRDFLRKKKDEIRIFDISDAILTPPRDRSWLKRLYQKIVANERSAHFLSECDAIIVAGQVQRDVMRKYNKNVQIMPDISYYHELFEVADRPANFDKTIFVWDGQGHNFPYLERVIQNNIVFFRRSDVLLKVITDRFDQIKNADNIVTLEKYEINSEFVEWKVDTFMKEVNSAHIGLAPVDLNCPHASAKPDNKLVNYQGLGLPVIASATRAYVDFSWNSPGGVITCKTDADWRMALEYWCANNLQAMRRGLLGRQYVLENYAPAVLAKRWQNIVLELAIASGEQ